MFMKFCTVFGMVILSIVATAGNVCRWRGDAGDGKWSNPKNWQDAVAPVSGGDDVVFVPGGTKVDVDSETFSLARLNFDGSGEVWLTGGEIVFNVTGMVLSNTTATVTIENALSVAKGGNFYTSTGDIDVKGLVTIADNTKLLVGTAGTVAEGTIRLWGGVVGPEGTLACACGMNSNSARRHMFVSSAHVREFNVGNNGGNPTGYRVCKLVLRAGGQQWTELVVGDGALIAAARNVFSPTAIIRPYTYWANATYDLGGFDQTIDRIAPDTRTDNGNTTVTSAEPATLTMRATGNGSFNGIVAGRASLVWDPVGNSEFTATGANTTEGGLTVSNGAFIVGSSGSFASATSLTVAEGATFSLESESSGALAGLRDVQLDGTLSIGADADSPFSGVVLTIGADGRITVPAGKTVTVGAIRLDGGLIEDKTYAAAEWLTPGGGSVKVDSTTLPDAFAWKDAVSGSWSAGNLWMGGQAPDGSKPVSVTAAGESYSVTVPAGTSLSKPLTVGNASGTGVASVVADGELALPGDSSLTVGRGGKVSIPAGTSLTLTGDPGTPSATRVIDITDGGELAVAGDFLATDLYGLVSVSGGGRISVSGGSFKCIPHSGGTGDYWNNRIDIGGGGLIDVSGGIFYPSVRSWGNCGMRLSGGALNVSQSGRLRFKADSQSVLGFGRIALSGDAVVEIEGDGDATVWMQAGGNNSKGVELGGDVLSILVADRASFSFGKTMFYIGYDLASVNSLAVNEFDYESAATSSFNRLVLGMNANRGSSVRAVLGRGRIEVGNYGLLVNKVESSGFAASRQVSSGGAVLSVTGGVLQVRGRYCDYAGVQIGNALPWSVHVPNRLDGRLEVSGGAVTNILGSIALGSGNAKGVIRMTGGTFCSANTRPAFFGVGDGEGRFEMTGGTASLNETVYLGIGETAIGLAYFMSEASRTAFTFGKTLDHCAKGVIDIEGGSFATTSNIVCGVDGDHGEIIVGPTGTIAAKDLCMSNATDSITVRIDGANGGAINLSGKLDVAAGVKLRILGAETIPDGTKPLTVISFAESVRAFAEEDIEVADGIPVVQTAKGIRVGKPKGLMLILR